MPEIKITEKELEDFIFAEQENPIEVYGKPFRQVNITGYGLIDLLYIDISEIDLDRNNKIRPYIKITIVELKKDKIDLNALGQICRYKTAIERYLRENNQFDQHGYITIEGVLVGNGYASGDICYAVDQMEWLHCWHYKIDLKKGISLDPSHGWLNSGEDFKGLARLKSEITKEYLSAYKEGTRRYRKYSAEKAKGSLIKE